MLSASLASPGVFAPMRAARAFVTFSSTCFSCAAYPFTVFTRFGMRSARRFSCTSICAQALSIAFSKRMTRL
jgi:hypothetical protein